MVMIKVVFFLTIYHITTLSGNDKLLSLNLILLIAKNSFLK